MSELTVTTRDAAGTALLGRAMATAALRANPGALLLQGDLGVGKTALASAMVKALPGGGEAETSSPSFTICNIYYTAPLVRHFDLYRLPPGLANDELAESLDDGQALTIVEWPQHMAKADAPADGALCRISRDGENNEARCFVFTPLGAAGRLFLDALRSHSHQQG